MLNDLLLFIVAIKKNSTLEMFKEGKRSVAMCVQKEKELFFPFFWGGRNNYCNLSTKNNSDNYPVLGKVLVGFTYLYFT